MKIKRKDDIILVIMEDGEDLLENLNTLREDLKEFPLLTVVTALGMLKNTEMGYWNGREYEKHELPDPGELLGISGIITPHTEPFYHFHVTLAKKDGTVAGGHLIKATVCNTLEMVLLIGNIETKRVQSGLLKKLTFKEV